MSAFSIDAMNARFSHLAGKDVVIYGMGQLASVLIDNRDNLTFRVVGVMDKEITQGSFKGIPVLNTDNMCEKACVIIIAALGNSCPIIYNRIAFLKERGVDIYFPDGEKRSSRDDSRASTFFSNMHDELTDLINSSDIISFDIFDTLLMRKCLFPHLVFSMMGNRFCISNFTEKRMSAEKAAIAELEKIPTIYEIYEKMDDIRVSAEDEIAVEKEMIVARGDMIFFFRYALELKKTIILTSDMYLPEAVMRDILADCHIEGYDGIYVSCDINASKLSGGMWKRIRDLYPMGSILHIGDNAMTDCVSQQGIMSHIIKGTTETADILGLGGAISCAEGVDDFIVIGSVLSRLLNLDLKKTDKDGGIVIDNAEDIGYCFVAPHALGFITWLIKMAASNDETLLCFCARDTFALIKLYEKLRYRYNAPPARYLYISKRILCGVLAETLINIKKCLNYYYMRFNPQTSIRDAVYRLFGTIIPMDPFALTPVKEVEEESLFKKIENSYFSLFKENAEKEKKDFLKYLKSNNYDVANIAIVDFICGQSVDLLSSLFSGNLYFFGLTAPVINPGGQKIHSWLKQTDSLYIPHYNIVKHLQLGEAVFSSPEGTCIAFDNNGTPILDNELKNFSLNEEIFNGIELFISEIDCPANCETSDNIFGALFSGNFSTSILTDIAWSSYTANK